MKINRNDVHPMFMTFYESNFRRTEKNVQGESVPSRRIRRRGRPLRSRRYLESHQPDDPHVEKPDSPIESP